MTSSASAGSGVRALTAQANGCDTLTGRTGCAAGASGSRPPGIGKSSLVRALVGADLLVLLTDVEGLLDAEGKRIDIVRDVEEVRSLVRPHESGGLSLGGMESKLESARRASLHSGNLSTSDELTRSGRSVSPCPIEK